MAACALGLTALWWAPTAHAQEIFAPGAAPAADAPIQPRDTAAPVIAPAAPVAEDVPLGEDVPSVEDAPSAAVAPMVEGVRTGEGVPSAEGGPPREGVPIHEGAAANGETEGVPSIEGVGHGEDAAFDQETAVDLAAPEATLAESGGDIDDPVVLDGTISVDVDAGSVVSIVGDTQSLRAVVEEICRQAGIDLRAYGAPDRRYVGRLKDVPIPDALRSMLRSESYLVGFQDHGAPSEARVTWLRVLGATGANGATAGAAPPAQPIAVPTPPAPPANRRFVISSSLLYQAFGTFDPARRDQAQREVLTRIADPEQLERFLSSDPKDLANMFGRYRNSDQTLRRLKSMADNPDVQAKLDAVLSEMGEPIEGETGEGEAAP